MLYPRIAYESEIPGKTLNLFDGCLQDSYVDPFYFTGGTTGDSA
jgi:hypothetical protein